MRKPFAITLDVGTSLANHTGSWRTERPLYLNRLPPCNHQCPAGENIQAWLFHAESGDYEQAWRTLVEDNPFPAIMGRVCYHSCEGACNRAKLDEAVGINSVERFLGDRAIAQGWTLALPAPASGHKVLVVGAGPSGLSAAYQLARLGHAVTVVEAGPLPGGMMRFGIPQYRLPRPVLDAEVQRIVDLGVRIEYNTKVTDVMEAKLQGGFDAVFLAVGAHIAKRAYIPAGSSAKMLDAVSVLRSMEGAGQAASSGGVWSSMAAATPRSTWPARRKRLGAEEAIIVYRRTREKMPAHDFEVEEALQEGVMIKWLSTIKQAGEASCTDREDGAGRQGLSSAHRRIRNSGGRFAGACAWGRTWIWVCSTAFPAWRSTTASSKVGANMMTGHDGHLCRWRHGARGAQRDSGCRTRQEGGAHIDAWLRGEQYVAAPSMSLSPAFEKLNTWYYADAPKTVRPMLDIIRRAVHLRRSAGRSRRGQCTVRSPALPVLWQLFRVRQLLRCLPGQCGNQARPRQTVSSSTTTIARAVACACRMSLRRDQDGAEEI
jgi:hypothetical protein